MNRALWEKRNPHGTFTRWLGTQEFDGCECVLCEAAHVLRREARKTFTYFERSKPVSRYARAAHKEWRSKKKVSAS